MKIKSEKIKEFGYLIDLKNTSKNNIITIDLTLESIQRITNKSWYNGIYKEGSKLNDNTYLDEIPDNNKKYYLKTGVYRLKLEQGLSLGKDVIAQIKSKDCLLRLGGYIESEIYEPEFKAEKIEVILFLQTFIVIEKGASLCQIVFEQI